MEPYWYPDKSKCGDCSVSSICNYLPTTIFPINGRVDILFVGQGIGAPYKRLKDLLIQVMKRYPRKFGVAFTNVTRNNNVRSIDEETHCRVHLVNDILKLKQEFKLEVIIPLGNDSCKPFINTDVKITKDHGKLFGMKIGEKILRIMPTYHPSYIIRNKKIHDHNRLHVLEKEFIEDVTNALNLC